MQMGIGQSGIRVVDRLAANLSSAGWAHMSGLLSSAETEAALDAFLADLRGSVRGSLSNWHLDHPWVLRLATYPALMATVTQLLGSRPVIWASELWFKPPMSGGFVPWHQDTYFWPVQRLNTVTAWLALTPSTNENGGLCIIPGTHLQSYRHIPCPLEASALDSEVPDEFLPLQHAVRPAVPPGDALLLDDRVVHASGGNRTPQPRLALSVRYAGSDGEPETDRAGRPMRRLITSGADGAPDLVLGWLEAATGENGT
jgi:ectoine hydroxylase-related dioxygenase (phytanoyl-CoA dioxygenase family)